MNDYKYEDGWRMVSKYAFGSILYNRTTGEVVRVHSQGVQIVK